MRSERGQTVQGLVKYFKYLSFYSQRNVEPLTGFMQRTDMIQWTFNKIIPTSVLRQGCRVAKMESERRLREATIVIWERNK